MTCTFRDIPGVGEDPPTPQGSVTDSVIRSQSGRILANWLGVDFSTRGLVLQDLKAWGVSELVRAQTGPAESVTIDKSSYAPLGRPVAIFTFAGLPPSWRARDWRCHNKLEWSREPAGAYASRRRGIEQGNRGGG